MVTLSPQSLNTSMIFPLLLGHHLCTTQMSGAQKAALIAVKHSFLALLN